MDITSAAKEKTREDKRYDGSGTPNNAGNP